MTSDLIYSPCSGQNKTAKCTIMTCKSLSQTGKIPLGIANCSCPGWMKCRSRFPWSLSCLGPSRYDADVCLIACRHGGSSLHLERGACACKIREKLCTSLSKRRRWLNAEIFFVRNQMGKGQSQSNCDWKWKLRESQIQGWASWRPNRLWVKSLTSNRKLLVRQLSLDEEVHDLCNSAARLKA